jgi:hypothetical protein
MPSKLSHYYSEKNINLNMLENVSPVGKKTERIAMNQISPLASGSVTSTLCNLMTVMFGSQWQFHGL